MNKTCPCNWIALRENETMYKLLSDYPGATSTMVTYYYAGSTRVAMRSGSTLRYLFNDHLGGTNVAANDAGGFYGSLRYYPWGESRYTGGSGIPTSFRYSGHKQDSYTNLEGYLRLDRSPLSSLSDQVIVANDFSLLETPCKNITDPRFLRCSDRHKEARSKIECHLSQKVGPVYLSVEVGAWA